MPMNPEHLPLLALLIAAVFLAGIAVRNLMTRRWVGGMRAGAIALIALALAFVGGTRLGRKEPPRITRLHGLVPSNPDVRPSDSVGTQLVLGGVTIAMAGQDRCVLAFEGAPFLTLDSLRTGVLLTCRVAIPDDGQGPIAWRRPSPAAWISQNVIFTESQGVGSSRPNPHSLALRQGKDELLHVLHLAPGRVEIQGALWSGDGRDGQIIDLRQGIRWPGGSISKGPVDLTQQGPGMIDLERNGSIRIVPE
jgi:hypothetical protein